MITTKVPKDIRKYKPKVLGNLTVRQLVCISLAAVADFLIYTLIMKPYDVSFDEIKWFVFAIDCMILAFLIEMEDMPMEKYLSKVIFERYFSPSHRIAKNVIIEKKKRSRKKTKRSKKALKKRDRLHPEYRPYA